MSLVRVQTVWTGVAGSPYYTNLYALGPLTTNNGNDLADAWHTALASIVNVLQQGLVATIDNELLEFDETNGIVSGAGSTIQTPVSFTLSNDSLPRSNQLLIQWATNGIVHNRRVRGRTFLPGAVESQNSSTGTPMTQIGTPVLSAMQALLTTMAGRMQIWSQPFVQEDPTNIKNPSRPGSRHAITGVTIAPYWAVLRSRRD